MTIEKALAENTAAVEANTAVQTKILAILEEGAKSKAGDKEESPRRREPEQSSACEDARESRRRDREADKDADKEEPRRSRRDRDDEKPADKEEPRRSRRDRDADDEKPADKKKPAADKKKAPKLADVRAAFATFLETDDKKEEDDRRDFVESILDELDCDKTSDIDEKDFERVLGWIADKTAGRKVRFDD